MNETEPPRVCRTLQPFEKLDADSNDRARVFQFHAAQHSDLIAHR